MKITLGSKALLEKLQFLGAVVPTGPAMPILENFLFTVEGDQLTITATDLDATMTSWIKVEADGPCKIALPAKILIDILKSFPEQPLVFNVHPNNTIDINSASGDYSIAYFDGAEFPTAAAIENPKYMELPSKLLHEAISKTIFATGNDDLRPIMAGVLFQFKEIGVYFVATDAHKLVKYSRTDYRVEHEDDEIDFVVPKKPLNVLKSVTGKYDEDVTVEYSATNVSFRLNDYTLTCRLIDGKYPNYEAVIPRDNPNQMIINRAQLLNAVKCVSIFANKITNQVKFDIDGNELHLSAEDVDYSNKAEERLTCNYSGEHMRIGFNSKFLTEMLSTLTCENIRLEMSLPSRAGIITPEASLADGEELLMLVMPVLIK